jgi:hypothetical protein
MTQVQVKQQGVPLGYIASYFLASYPFIRYQTYVQTQASFPGLTSEFIKKPANFYKGGLSFLVKHISEIYSKGIPLLYPLELQQIRAASYKGQYEASIQSAFSNFRNKTNWTGFYGMLGVKSVGVINLYSVIHGYYMFMPLICLGEVVLDNVRRNFVVRNFEGEKVSYKQVFESLLKDKNILRAWQYYPSIYFSLFIISSKLFATNVKKD